MSRFHKIIELGKSLLIICLVAGAAYLANEAGVAGKVSAALPFRVRAVLGPAGSPGQDFGSVRERQGVLPFYISVNQKSGLRYGVKHSGEELEITYEKLSLLFGEALGSSVEASRVEDFEFRNALDGESVYLDFLNEQMLPGLAHWHGTKIDGEPAGHTARRFLLSEQDGAVFLYYLQEPRGQAYRCRTAVTAASLSAWISGFSSNGARFAYEFGGKYSKLDPYALVMDSIPPVLSVAARNPFNSGLSMETILPLFGVNSFLETSYTEQSGTAVYVEGEKIIRVSAEGELVFRQQGETGLKIQDDSHFPTVSELIDETYKLAMSGVGNSCGEGRLTLSQLSYDPQGARATVAYDYVLNGLPVRLFTGRAAEFEIEGSSIRRATFLFREYSYTGAEQQPLPESIAYATLQSRGGGEPVFIYDDTGDKVSGYWIGK